MYGDPDVLRRHVDHLREQALDVRARADQLVAQTESIAWRGRAAESMRARVIERATHLRRAAARHESAAEAMDRHVLQVERSREAIAAIERKATALVAEARVRVARVEQANADQRAGSGGSGVRVQPQSDDVVLVASDAPPSGHVDWLGVELPGLSTEETT